MYLFTRCGTPGFVAPEVINIKDMKAKYQPICDIFSLGLIFYMLLFGKSLFKSKNYNDLVKENRESKFNFEEKEFGTVEKETKDLMMKMLRVNPEERINAEQALEHPYFKLDFTKPESEDEEEAADQVSMDMATAITPPMGQVMKQFRVKKDSCIEFKLGKENIMIGKTESVENVGSTKVSVGKEMEKGLGKMSKFTVRQKENV
jgi:serine/threonine protein kinase